MGRYFRLLNLIASKKPRLPSIYQEVEYIKGEGSAYLDTQLTSYKNTYIYKIGIKRYSDTTRFVSFVNPEADKECIGMFSTGAGYSFQNGINTRVSSLAASTTSFHDIIIEKDGFTIDSVKTAITARPEFTVNKQLYIFAGQASVASVVIDSRKSIDAIKYYQIYDENSALIRNFIPCYRKSDDKPGMYDIVNNVFYTNANASATTDFIVGPDVN